MKHYIMAILILVSSVSVMIIVAKAIGVDAQEAVVNGLLSYLAFKTLIRDIKESEQ